jgi:hypothetical protein
MWEPRRLTTVCAFTTCYRDSFTFCLRNIAVTYFLSCPFSTFGFQLGQADHSSKRPTDRSSNYSNWNCVSILYGSELRHGPYSDCSSVDCVRLCVIETFVSDLHQFSFRYLYSVLVVNIFVNWIDYRYSLASSRVGFR